MCSTGPTSSIKQPNICHRYSKVRRFLNLFFLLIFEYSVHVLIISVVLYYDKNLFPSERMGALLDFTAKLMIHLEVTKT